MRLHKEIYEFVKFVENENTKRHNDRLMSTLIEVSNGDDNAALKDDLIEDYSSNKKITEPKARKICENAVRRKYLDNAKSSDGRALVVSGKGLAILQKFGPLKYGLWLETIEFCKGFLSIAAILLSVFSLLVSLLVLLRGYRPH